MMHVSITYRRHGTVQAPKHEKRYYSLMDELSEGQIVELKSGGPKMTVKSVDGPTAVCMWFSGEKLSENSFPSTTLIPTRIESLSDKQLEDILRKSEKRD